MWCIGRSGLAEGGLVALPTETVYGLAASALDEDAVGRLLALKDRTAAKPLTLAIKAPTKPAIMPPTCSRLARRLARRCWPGPVTLVVDDSHPESLVCQLAAQVQQAVSPTVDRPARAGPSGDPRRDADVGRPAGLTSANRAGSPRPRRPRKSRRLRRRVRPGARRRAVPLRPAVLRRPRGQAAMRVLRAGVVPERTLQRLSSLMVLFVCTGNTCRSPMAECSAARCSPSGCSCSIDELEDRGVLVMSAGIAAMMGGRASREAVEIMADLGLDLPATRRSR